MDRGHKVRSLKYSKKIQFLPFFPYGICSKLATTISGQDNPYCSEILMGDNADALLNLCVKHKNNATLRAKTACAQGYVAEKFYVCTDTTKPLCFRVLTGQGLKRVFAGYVMDIAKINKALEDYLNGEKFYLACFPDQARWYKHLFPGISIL